MREKERVCVREREISRRTTDLSKPQTQLDCIRHLPKTDTFGRCDSYVVIELGPASQVRDKVCSF